MENQNNMNNGAMLAALGYPVALPQTVVPVTKTQYQVQRTTYDPQKMAALKLALATKRDMQPLKDALAKPRPVMSAGEAIANALAQYPEARSYTGGFGEEIISPWAEGLSGFARGFGTVYGARKASEREAAQQAREDAIKAAQLDVEAAEKAREDAIKAAQLELDASKTVSTSQTADDFIKYNNPNAGGDVAYRFEPDRIKDLKELNDKAGRWATQWGKGMSDMADTEQSRAYNEFEGKAKQYVQDQLKKIYGAQMTEQEGERFFKSMGLSPYLAPELRWSLVENALEDVARKNGTTMQQQVATPTQQNATNARPLPQKGQIVDGYEFLGGDPADAKNWRAK